MANNRSNDIRHKEGKALPLKEGENLGLDADQSSADSPLANLNRDNDRVSHNPDGEDDDHDSKELPGHSPLMDK